MIIYSYQPESLIDRIQDERLILVDVERTNLARLVNEGVGDAAFDAYLWMARKMCEKTGIWMKSIYGPDLPLPKDADGDYIEANGQKMVLFPFWGWYLTNGINQKPDSAMYCFDSDILPEFNWNKNKSKTKLLTLDIPERFVLLSDANAWYCALEGRPCFEYESPEEEARLTEEYNDALLAFRHMPTETAKQRAAKSKVADSIWEMCTSSWDNILRLEGRAERVVFGAKERHDIQAVFPFIANDWIVGIDNV